MKRLLLPLASLVAALVLPSCLQQATTIHLNKDGSGTLVEETTLGAQLTAMLGGIGADPAKNPLNDLTSAEKTAARAAALGEGVTVEKTEVIEANGSKGARVTYRFTDINQLKFSSAEAVKGLVPAGPGAPAQGAAEKVKIEPTSFKFADGVLTIINPELKQPAAAPKPEELGLPGGADEAQNAQMEAMMTQMMGDMKISMKIVAEPGIAETNAAYVDDKTITLMEMDMAKVLKNADAFKRLRGIDRNNPNAAANALKGFDGIKAETQKEITLKLK